MTRGSEQVRRRDGTRFEKLIAWQKAYDLVLKVYQRMKGFPTEERFGLAQQVRRAAVSVPSNIAEGWGRGSTVDYLRFLHMARGSLYELQTQLWIAADLGYIEAEHEIYDLVREVERLTNGLIRSLMKGSESC
jgi:four helix bundle protein